MRATSTERLAAAALSLLLLFTGSGLPGRAQSPSPSAGGSVSLGMPTDADLDAAAALTPATLPETVPAEVDLAAIDTSIRDLFAGLPASDWTIPDLSEAMQYDPTQPFVFVRDRTAFDPYAGVLRGAEGTLAARAGNAWDRALLLQALLGGMLVQTRLVWGDLDPALAASLVTRALEARPDGLQMGQALAVSGLDPAALTTRAHRDYAVLRRALGDRLTGTAGDDTVALADVTRHVWVQAFIGTSWVDLDPTLPDAQPGSTITPALGTLLAVPAADRQTVQVSVVAEHLADGALTQDTVLDHTLDAADDAAKIITLTFKPQADQLGSTIETAFSGVSTWSPVLGVGDDQYDGTAFVAGGRGTDLFGEDVAAPELTALRLEIVSAGPGRSPVTATSDILDRIPPAVRATGTIAEDQLLPLPGDDSGPTAMSRITHLMLSTGGLDARAHVGDLGAGLEYVNDVLLDPEAAARQTLDDILRPLMAIDDDLVAGSEYLSVPALRSPGLVGAFVAAPRVYLSTFGPADTPGDIMYRFDLALDGVRVLADPSVPVANVAARRLWYGVLQSAVETELGLARGRSEDTSSTRVAGASLSSGGDMTVLSATDIGDRTDLPADLVAALADGGLVVAPPDPAVPIVWWSVRPDGLTRSVLSPGYGGWEVVRPPPGSNYKGVRQLPRVPGGNSGGGGRAWGNQGGKTVPVGETCRVPASDSTGYGMVVQCVSLAGFAFKLALAVAIDAVIFAAIWALFKSVEAPGY